MTIAFKKYIDITSGVGGGAAVPQRDLIGRLFTTNPLLPPSSFIEFTTAEDVGIYFGTSSEEYLRAAFYFAWISKNITRAKKISFARWVDAAVAPLVYGAVATYTLSNFTSVSSGSIGITMGANTTHLTGINLSGAASLAAVAALIQTAVRAYTAGGALFTGATVSYDATRKSFNLIGGASGAADMAITAGSTGTDIASRLGWLTGSIQADGSAVQTITDVLGESAQGSNNFASFLFMPALDDGEVEEAAAWNALQNVMYIFCQRVIATDAQDYYDMLIGYAGTGISLAPLSTEYPEMAPMIILAATDYTRQNSVQNYEFQQFPTLTPSVSTTLDSDAYDDLRVNYIGVTQQAGRRLAFYQQGVLMGGSTAPVDMNTYANEIWLKDYIGSTIMDLLLSVSRVSANASGRAQVQAVISAAIELALFNGTISVGKPLNITQKLYIGEITGDDLAWQQVQNIGWWLNVFIDSTTTDGVTTFIAKYTLVYSKDDTIRKVEGSNVLI